jgi:hypothetical protein
MKKANNHTTKKRKNRLRIISLTMLIGGTVLYSDRQSRSLYKGLMNFNVRFGSFQNMKNHLTFSFR